jgi:hypothetical protein
MNSQVLPRQKMTQYSEMQSDQGRVIIHFFPWCYKMLQSVTDTANTQNQFQCFAVVTVFQLFPCSTLDHTDCQLFEVKVQFCLGSKRYSPTHSQPWH